MVAPQPRMIAPQPRMVAPPPRMVAPQPRMVAPQPRIVAPQPRMVAPQPRRFVQGPTLPRRSYVGGPGPLRTSGFPVVTKVSKVFWLIGYFYFSLNPQNYAFYSFTMVKEVELLTKLPLILILEQINNNFIKNLLYNSKYLWNKIIN